MLITFMVIYIKVLITQLFLFLPEEFSTNLSSAFVPSVICANAIKLVTGTIPFPKIRTSVKIVRHVNEDHLSPVIVMISNASNLIQTE
jgi:hypothetical protein